MFACVVVVADLHVCGVIRRRWRMWRVRIHTKCTLAVWRLDRHVPRHQQRRQWYCDGVCAQCDAIVVCLQSVTSTIPVQYSETYQHVYFVMEHQVTLFSDISLTHPIIFSHRFRY